MSLSNNFPTIRPTLNLDFANSGVLDPRITFTRTTTATYYDAETVALAEQNLVTFSEQFDNAAWTKNAATISANTAGTTAPDGTSTADKLVETAATDTHEVLSAYDLGGTFGTYAHSAYMKAAERTQGVLRSDGGGQQFTVIFDLSGGTIVSESFTGAGMTKVSTSITSVGNGWYRCAVVFTLTSGNSRVRIGAAEAGATSYAGDITKGIYIWGAQREVRSSVTAYTPTTTQAITNYIPQLMTASAGQPRFDYDPITRVAKGLLIEEARTNLCTYSGSVGGTNWVSTAAGGGVTPTITLNYATAPDGTQTASRLQLSLGGGTTTSDFAFVVQTLTGTSCRGSIWLKTNDGSTKTVYLRANLNPSVTISGTWTRYDWDAGTLSGTQFGVGLRGGQTPTNSNTADILVWGAQLEAGAFATSYIPTVASTVQRNAEIATMTGTNFSSWYSANAGTFVATISTSGDIVSSYAFSATNIGSATNIIGVDVDASSILRLRITNVSVNQALVTMVNPIAANTTYKTAGAFATNDFAAVANGGAVSTDTSGTVPAVDYLAIGSATSAGPISWNGWIQSIRYYPLRLTNTQLQNLTKS